jgi:flagellar hook protein FlgE
VHYTLDSVDAARPTSTSARSQLTAINGAAPTPAALALGTPTGALPLAVNIDYAGTTQFAGAANTTTNRADGYASGHLHRRVDQRRRRYGHLLATAEAERRRSPSRPSRTGALIAVSDTSWTTSTPQASRCTSRARHHGRRADHRRAGAVERRHHVGLVSLMTSQRNYRANSKVISTEVPMLQALCGRSEAREMDALSTAMSGAERRCAQRVPATSRTSRPAAFAPTSGSRRPAPCRASATTPATSASCRRTR